MLGPLCGLWTLPAAVPASQLAWRNAGEGIANFKPRCQFIPPQKVDELIINALSNVKSVPIRSINCNGSNACH